MLWKTVVFENEEIKVEHYKEDIITYKFIGITCCKWEISSSVVLQTYQYGI